MDPNVSPIDPGNDAITNLARSRFSQMESSTLGGVAAGESSFKRQQEDVNLAQSRSEKADQLKILEDAKAEMNNPNNYKKVRNPNTGGFEFFDPLGNTIPFSQYTDIVGEDPEDTLKDSLDVNDLQFLRERSDLGYYLNAKINQNSGDLTSDEKQDITDIEENNTQLKTMDINSIVALFRKRYNRYYQALGNKPDAPEDFLFKFGKDGK